jgi:hypothetical protein
MQVFPSDPARIRIRATVLEDSRCSFDVDWPMADPGVVCSLDRQSIAESELAAQLFTVDGVLGVVVEDRVVTVTQDRRVPWRPQLAVRCANAIRRAISTGRPLIRAVDGARGGIPTPVEHKSTAALKGGARRPVTMKSVALGFGIAIAAVLLTWLVGSKAHSWRLQSTDAHLPAEQQRNTSQPAIEIEVRDLLAAYVTNEIDADLHYHSRRLRLSGIIDTIAKDVVGTMYVTFTATRSGRRVQCFFATEWADTLAKLRPGDSAYFGGTCSGLFGNVLLNDCTVIWSQPGRRR